MKDQPDLDKYRDLPCGAALFPEYLRLFRLIGRLRHRGLLAVDDHSSATPVVTIGEILDIDVKQFALLPGVGERYVRALSTLQYHILSFPDTLTEWSEKFEHKNRKQNRKQERKSDPALTLPKLPYALSDFSLNYRVIDNVEQQLVRKLRKISDKKLIGLVELIVTLPPSKFRFESAIGSARLRAYTLFRNKIFAELNAIAQSEGQMKLGQISLLRLSEYHDIDLASLDQNLVDDVEYYLFNLDDFDQDVALSRLGFHQSKETLESIGKRREKTREYIRQKEARIFDWLPNFIRVDSKILKQNIRENLTSSLTEILPTLAACFDDERHFYSFIEVLCRSKKNSILNIAHPKLKSRMLDTYFCENASPIHYQDLMEELTSSYGQGSTLAHNTIRELEKLNRLRITEVGIYPLNLGKNEAVAHILSAHPNGLPWKDVARIVNKSGCCSTKINEDRLFEHGFNRSDHIYLCGRGTYRNVIFLDLSQVDVQDLIEAILEYLQDKNATSIHLNDYYYQSDSEAKRLGYYELRYVVQTFGEDFGLFFQGRSSVDTVGVTPNFERITQSKLIAKILEESERALTITEIASRLKSKSTQHARAYMDQLMQSGEIIRVDNLMYTTPEKAFTNVDKDSILCMIDDILLDSGRPVECDVFRLKINREFGLSFPKYFYASLAYLNMDEFGWYRSGNLFGTEKLGCTSMRAYVDEYCNRDAARMDNLDMLKRVVDVTDQAGLSAIDSWKQTTSGLA